MSALALRALQEIDPPVDLTIPEAGSGTARRVLSRALGRLLAEVGDIGRSVAAIRTAKADSIEIQRLVVHSLKHAVGALASALRSPSVGTLVRCLRPGRAGSPQPDPGLLAELIALLALELARTCALPGPVRLRNLPSRLLSPAGRFAVSIPSDVSSLLFEDGRVAFALTSGVTTEALDLSSIATGGPRVSQPYHVIDGSITLALADNNPLAMMDTHPDKVGNAVDLGGRPIGEWVCALQEALALIKLYLPDVRSEIDLFIHQVVPVGWDAERHLSASYQEAIGTIYMSLHPSPMMMAEALIHEFSHNKLNALFEIDEVLENAWHPLYTSPVRPDPRPLHGVLLAVHAFLPIVRLYELMVKADDPAARSASFIERFTRIRKVNREGARILLERGRPTVVGRSLLDEIHRWSEYFVRLDTDEGCSAAR